MLILDGSRPGDPTGGRITQALRAHRPDARAIVLHEARIGNCAGDFLCWTRTPGLCSTDDDNRRVAGEYVRSDLAVLLTPVTFGAYSSALKRGVDHLIQILSPRFATIAGETHHRRRYPSYPDLLVIGWQPAPDPGEGAVFRRLVARNALNFHARTTVCQVVTDRLTGAELTAAAGAWLDQVRAGTSSAVPDLPSAAPDATGPVVPPRRAVLLVGSPRTTRSTSHALGNYLLQQLASAGLETESVQLYTRYGSPARRQTVQPTLDAADLLVLAFPLYVDALPAPTTAALEHLAALRRDADVAAPGGSGRIVAIANCGFPEAAHTATALAICRQFARQAGYGWAGGLGLGGGEGVVGGRSLEALGGRGARLRAALSLASAELAAGRAVPPEAIEQFAAPAVPAWAYRTIGGVGWWLQARRQGAVRRLSAQPYAAAGSGR